MPPSMLPATNSAHVVCQHISPFDSNLFLYLNSIADFQAPHRFKMWKRNKHKAHVKAEEALQQSASGASTPRQHDDTSARGEAVINPEQLVQNMEGENHKKVDEIARREMQVDGAEREASRKKEEAVKRDENVMKKEEAVAQREQRVKMREEELARRETEVARRESAIERRTKTMAGMEQRAARHEIYEKDNDEAANRGGSDESETSRPPLRLDDELSTLQLRVCTGKLEFVPWYEANSLRPPSATHAAVEVPQSQPSDDEFADISDKMTTYDQPHKKEPPPNSAKTVSKRPFQRRGWQSGDTDHPDELPDRIRICSLRLALYIDFNIHDGSLNQSTINMTPYTIPRPFKILVEKESEIRNGLDEMEKIRLQRFPHATDADHEHAWEANTPPDLLRAPRFDANSADQEELTAMIKDLRCLVQFMDGYITPSLRHIGSSPVYFSDLWFVFPARSLLYLRDQEVPQKIWKVIQRTGGARDTTTPSRPSKRVDRTHDFLAFYIDCYHLDHDGTRYLEMFRQIKIEYFEGCQPISSLPVIPFDVAQALGYIDGQTCLRRGKEFVQCTTQPRHKQYTSRNQIFRPDGAKLHEKDADVPDNATRYAEWIESEVMVDFQRALQEIPNWRPRARELELFKPFPPPRDRRGIDIDTVWDNKLSDQVADEAWEKCQTWERTQTHPSKKEDLLLLPNRVFGFVFRTRKWACLRLGPEDDGSETLRDKKRRLEPWNDLQLPDGHKRLVQSLIESHSSGKGHRGLHFDVVRAKGRGVTILLHGVPGVGKTSTAECAAESNNRPLFPITCGDLGTSPREVEKKLEEAFQLAQLWECVLLLDEADIFLAQRTESDIARNAMVSVFLRVLEYYEGILFLTTNRVGVFDEAFKSRIHLPLYCPPLEWKNTEKIWRIHLKKLVESDLVVVNESDILEYAEHFFDRQNAKGSKVGPVWNGRQIRNAFQSAVALAGYGSDRSTGNKICVGREHFESVARVSDHFNAYTYSIKMQTDSDKAVKWGYRFDGYQDKAEGTITHTPFQATGMPYQMPVGVAGNGAIYGAGTAGQRTFNPTAQAPGPVFQMPASYQVPNFGTTGGQTHLYGGPTGLQQTPQQSPQGFNVNQTQQ
ncbi:hypothetical protein B0J18DRAFT_438741 [Chaetomium sp. MPI-SDFR-AT-0129]|nr:hypothetical protein B0J18DRAFT_438741 [Chaetomium sp. MPI-SDFR-AT-0129]